MKSITFPIVIIFFTTLLISESFKIKRDLTYNKKENAFNLPIILNDEDINDIEKRRARRPRRRRSKGGKRNDRQRLQSLVNTVGGLRNELVNFMNDVNKRLSTVQTVQN